MTNSNIVYLFTKKTRLISLRLRLRLRLGICDCDCVCVNVPVDVGTVIRVGNEICSILYIFI